MSNNLIDREITQGIIPIGTPKAYKYDAALVEAAKATVQQGMTGIAEKTEEKKSEVSTLGQSYVDSASKKVTEANTILSAIRNEYGYPFTAATAADMTDTSKIYVYTGSETGYTNGNWYYYDGAAWVSGGVYNAIAFETDKTLSVDGAAADAKATGKSIQAIYDGKERLLLTTLPGYIDGYGAIAAQTATSKEVYTNKIPVEPGDVLDLSLEYGSAHVMWLAVAIYDNTETFIQRYYIVNNVTQTTYNGQYTVPANASYIAFTYRTYDDAFFSVVKGNIPYVDRIFINSDNIDNLTDFTISESRNIFDSAEYVWEKKFYNATGVYINSASEQNCSVAPIIPVEGGETYTFSWGTNTTNGNYRAYVQEFDSDGTRIIYTVKDNSANSKGSITITLNANTVKVGLMFYATTNTDNWRKLIPSYYQIEKGEEATSYVPHLILNDNRLDYYTIYNVLKEYFGGNEVSFAELASSTVPNIAHRGDDILAPQCTAPAYIEAKKRGFSIAENDLFYSQDNKLVMWHDTSLVRLGNMVDINGYLMYTDGTDYYWVHPTTNAVYTWDGNNYVASAVDLATLTRCNGSNYSVNNQYEPTTIGLNFDVLRRIDFGLWKGSQFRGTQILTFEEWILLCKQLGMGAYVDRKLTYTDALLTEAGNTVKRLGMGEYTSWLGLSGAQINSLRTIIPHARCGILGHPTAENVISNAQYNVDGKFFFNGNANTMTEEAIHTGLDAGFEVEVWYVEYGSTAEEQILAKIREAVSYGVTGITLDHYRTNDAFAYLLE